MDAELVKHLSDEEYDAVEMLITECNHADHTNYDTELDGDFYYFIRNDSKEDSGVDCDILAVLSGYLLGETIDGKQVLEIEAFTHPLMRGIGLFTQCYQSLLDDFRGYRIRFMIKRPLSNFDPEPISIHFEDPNDTSSPSSQDTFSDTSKISSAIPFVAPDTWKCLSSLQAVHQYDELFMKKALARPIANPGDTLSCEQGEVFLDVFNDTTLYLHGLLVYDRYLRQGFGRKIMTSVENSPSGPYRNILLQVSTSNAVALHLYQSMGYEETERILYFLNPVDPSQENENGYRP